METGNWFWIGFNAFVLLMLALDLGVFHRKPKAVSVKEGLLWSGVWIALALLFNAFIYYGWGKEMAIEFFTGYLVEKTLSVDNIFVFVLIFNSFKIPPLYQHRVLFWGILGALLMRIIFIFAGVALLEKFHWMIYLFGAFLLFTGYKMLTRKKENDSDKTPGTPLISFFKRFMPVTDKLHGDRFFIRSENRFAATPLFLVLLLIEVTDLVFAVDSIPAILAITQDQFIVYTSNVFAILGLRSLYFALAGIIHRFKYLSIGLALVLIFVGIKMMIVDLYKLPAALSLGIILLLLISSILYSLKKVR